MAPILDIEVECGEQKSRLLRGMVVLRGMVNYCTCRYLSLIVQRIKRLSIVKELQPRVSYVAVEKTSRG